MADPKQKSREPMSKLDKGIVQQTPEMTWAYEKIRRRAQGIPYSPAVATKLANRIAGGQLALIAAESAQLATSEEARRLAEAEADKLANKGAIERMATAAFVDTPGTIYAAGRGLTDTYRTMSEVNKAEEERSRNFLEETERQLAEFEADEARRDAERAMKAGGAPSRSQKVRKTQQASPNKLTPKRIDRLA